MFLTAEPSISLKKSQILSVILEISYIRVLYKEGLLYIALNSRMIAES
jgi:hypothetical protein